MKLEIFDHPSKEETPVRLKLVEAYDGVEVHAVDGNGERLSQGSLLRFDKDGTVTMFSSVDTTLGFQLSTYNSIVTKNL